MCLTIVVGIFPKVYRRYEPHAFTLAFSKHYCVSNEDALFLFSTCHTFTVSIAMFALYMQSFRFIVPHIEFTCFYMAVAYICFNVLSGLSVKHELKGLITVEFIGAMVSAS